MQRTLHREQAVAGGGTGPPGRKQHWGTAAQRCWEGDGTWHFGRGGRTGQCGCSWDAACCCGPGAKHGGFWWLVIQSMGLLARGDSWGQWPKIQGRLDASVCVKNYFSANNYWQKNKVKLGARLNLLLQDQVNLYILDMGMRWYLGQKTANLPVMEDFHHPSGCWEPAWIKGNTLGEVGQVSAFFKFPYLPDQLCHGLAGDCDAWLRKADKQHISLM